MARRRAVKREIRSYRHSGRERVNNPPVGLVTGATDPDAGQQTYEYDPHLDPQLVWSGKAEHTSFEVPTVSLHVHERIDPRSIIEAVRRRNGGSWDQDSLFASPEENPPMRQAVEFYRHHHNWTNRLVAGDSLLVMNSLLEKEGLGGQVQMIYIDPPYGIRYGSNFQPFVNKRDVRDARDDDLTREPETIRAFRDTWELGIHSYLTYLRDRLLLAMELLHESGSVFVQIGDENIHFVRVLMDEVFGSNNFVNLISFATSTGSAAKALPRTTDYILWYARDLESLKSYPLYHDQNDGFSPKGTDHRGEYELASMTSQDPSRARSGHLVFQDQSFSPSRGRHWSFDPENFNKLVQADRIVKVSENQIRWKRYRDERVRGRLTNRWNDTQFAGFASDKVYVVQSTTKVIERCVLMATDPGDLVFDPTCGSGTTAYVAEQRGRRWITCDTSRVALTLARQRLMTAVYDYYQLSHPDEGVGSGFRYKTVPHVTLGSIANNPDIEEGMSQADIDAAIVDHASHETLYDQPLVDTSKRRVTGPFTVEAVPAPAVRPLDTLVDEDGSEASAERSDNGFEPAVSSRSGETVRQADWRDELLTTGIRGKAGQQISFTRLEPQAGTRWLHAVGETQPDDSGVKGFREASTAYMPQRVAVSFGPDHAPLEQLQVEHAWEEARALAPPPDILVFAAFQFDPEAAKDIDELDPKLMGMHFLKAQMNADLLTGDLKRKRSSNESFWLIGQPDVALHQIRWGQNAGKWQVQVRGFDYFNTMSGGVESGGEDRITMWMLDPDYDGRSLFPQQVFFPMAGSRDGWAHLARNLKAEIDEHLIEAYRGTVSLPFTTGAHSRIAVKIVDDRGLESVRTIQVKD